MPKLKNHPSPILKKTTSAQSRQKSSVLSALESLDPFTGDALITAAEEGLQALREKKTLRKFNLSAPSPLEPFQIVSIRNSLKASQGVFASYLGVSRAAVISWEYGVRKPSGAALKLLSIARKNPSILVEA